jgi:hypothetical protein
MAVSTIRSLGVLSYAKVQGALCAMIGLIVGLIFALLSFFGAAIGHALNSGNGDTSPLIGAFFGIGAVVICPIVYGIIGFVAGAVSGLVYNLAARMVGGIEIELV